MTNDNDALLRALKAEREFLDAGGYRKPSWRPQFIFQDSPTCMNHDNPEHPKPCSECVLMPLVPEDCRDKKVPCRQIPLNAQGETIEYFYRCGTQDELENALGTWLQNEIRGLESQQPPVQCRACSAGC